MQEIFNDEKVSQEPKDSAKEAIRIIDSKELFGEEKVVMIKHGNQIYRLMITRQEKLILNK